VRTTVLNELTLVHDDDLVEVEYCIELVGDGDEGVMWESGAEEALDMGVTCSIETKRSLLAIDLWKESGW
jgi:hypothetical protein